MIELINDIKNKLSELEKQIALNEKKMQPSLPQCFPTLIIDYVNLQNSTNVDKLERMIKQMQEYEINILPTSKDSQVVRSAIVAEFGEEGLYYWLSIRKLRENFDETMQTKKYNQLISQRSKNTITFGAVVNRYKKAVNLFNDNNNIKMH